MPDLQKQWKTLKNLGGAPPKPADPLRSTTVSGHIKLAKQKAQLMDILGNENKFT